MARAGRNDPCPCGSGKKYKKCCLAKDEAAARQQVSQVEADRFGWGASALPERTGTADEDLVGVPSLLPPLPPRELAPEEQALDDLWERFEAASPDEHAGIFTEALEAGQLDGETAYDMLDEILVEARRRGDLPAYERLVAHLQAEAPDLYREEAFYYSWTRLENDLESGETGRVAELLAPFALEGDRGIDSFFRVIEMLEYYGQIRPLLVAMREAWPRVRDSKEITAYGRQEYAETILALTMLDYLETASSPDADDPGLRAALAPYMPDEARFGRRLRALMGQLGRSWLAEDFGKRVSEESLYENLALLSFEWIGEAWRSEGQPLGKARLAQATLVEYQVEQAADAGLRGTHLLVPKRKPLDHFLAGMLNPLNMQHRRVVALIELLPSYLRFLTTRGLASEVETAAAWKKLEDVVSAVETLRTAREPEIASLWARNPHR